MLQRHMTALAVAVGLTALAQPGFAQDTYKIGSAVGLTGYAAASDRAWRDGQALAVEALNAKGGLLGKKVEYIAEDNRSEPQEAVVVYRKMMSNDKVNVFASGCVSAGNFAAAGAVVRAETPMVLCSILPPRPEEVKWAYSILPPPRFEMEARYNWLKANTQVRKIGIMHDPTPYAQLMRDVGVKSAQEAGFEVVAVESYKPDDVDMSVQIGRINAAGAGAIVKMGQGGSTVTIAKNIKQLGLEKMILLASLDDGAPLKAAGEELGERFMFVAPRVQIPAALQPGEPKEVAEAFLKIWREKFGDRDPNAGARGWDSVMVIAKAVQLANSFEGPKVRDAVEKISGFQGSFAKYNFSPEQHVGITENPYVIGVLRGGQFQVK
ncbi:ABC transporter substrate-binding protein [uncultured Alsobacter sp.]|uniref:ABC transporter substrate-binding protein n=1 Tax=uncultured Alsobacter sp. TaxID=1748258 RepID=UPI0025CFB378|nr:ABC transporter substrate-binding protein [uncultured Alsobacter sp.]